LVAILRGGVGGHGDDDGLPRGGFCVGLVGVGVAGCLGVGVAGADDAGGFEAIHFGHLDVHEDEVIGGLL